MWPARHDDSRHHLRNLHFEGAPASPLPYKAVRMIRGALKLAGYVDTAAGRRAHTERHRVLALYGFA